MARRDTARLMLTSSGITVLGALPPFLLGAQAVLIQRDLDFGAASLGLAVGVFFGSAALATVVVGALWRRWGMRGSLALAGLLVATGGFAMALLVQTLPALLLTMGLLGAGNAACQATSNATVATVVPPHRRGLGFGIKQSAVPMAIMLGGLAVPTTTVLFGWRSTYLVTGSIGLLVLLAAIIRRPATGTGTGPRSRARITERLDQAPWGPLVLCGAAIVLASSAANFAGAYLASWAHEVGLTIEQAGLLVAAGSGGSILVRIAMGHQADRRHGRNLPVVALQMLIGGACLILLGVLPHTWAVVVFGALAFTAGWSWPGLFLYAVARLGRDAPTKATLVIQAGAFGGGALGPVLLGLLVGAAGFQISWVVAGGLFVLAGACTLASVRGFREDLRRRPPAEPFGYGGGRVQPRFVTGTPPEGETRPGPEAGPRS